MKTKLKSTHALAILRTLVAMAATIVTSGAYADDLEDFFRRQFVGNVTPAMFHDQGRFIVNAGNQTLAMNKAELLQLYQKLKGAGVKTEIVALKFSGRVDSENMVSVVVKAKVKQTVGSTRSESESESHEILLKDRGQYVSVFSLAKQ